MMPVIVAFIIFAFMVGMPIYAYLNPTLVTAFFAGVAMMLNFQLLVNMTSKKSKRNFGIHSDNDN